MIFYSAILTTLELICQIPEGKADVGLFAPKGSKVRSAAVVRNRSEREQRAKAAIRRQRRTRRFVRVRTAALALLHYHENCPSQFRLQRRLV